jgi:hypothetical protein
MAFKKFKILIAALAILSSACQYEYGIMGHGAGKNSVVTEVIEVEVEVEVPVEVEVEVPVYIEVEVPVPDTSDPGLIWIDSFNQPNTFDGVDILWVIDTSGSMSRYDPQLMTGIEAMLLALPATSWRLVMISNDPHRAVVEAQFPLVPGDDILDAEAMYSAMGRGGMEEGFDATYEYIMYNPYSSTWMREDAALLVVFVSDEEEQSRTHFIDVSSFVTWYGAQRGGSVFISSIVNHEAAETLCDWPPGARDIGYRYMEATNHFGGTIIDICAEDWSAGVADAASSVVPHESWKLTHEPVESSIRVFINGAVNADWTYSASDNTVYFTVTPVGGTLVEIGYLYVPIEESGDTGP